MKKKKGAAHLPMYKLQEITHVKDYIKINVICRECGREVMTENQSKEDGEQFTVNLLNSKKSA